MSAHRSDSSEFRIEPQGGGPRRGSQPAPSRPPLSTASLLALCASLAAAMGLLHWMLVDGRTHDGQVDAHLLMLSGRGPYPDQYRLLTYALAEGLMRLGLTFDASYQWPRFAFTAMSFYVFHEYLRDLVRPAFALLGLFMLAAVLPLTYLFYSMQPTDPLNMLVFFTAFWMLARQRDGWLVPLTVVGTLNRETALLLPPLYALLRAGRAPLSRWLPRALVAAACGVAIYAGLRLLLGLRPPYAPISPLVYWQANATDRGTWIQLLGFFNLTLWVGWSAWHAQPPFLRRAVWLAPVFFLIHFSVGYVREVRYFLPLLPVLVPMALVAMQYRAEGPADEPGRPTARLRLRERTMEPGREAGSLALDPKREPKRPRPD